MRDDLDENEIEKLREAIGNFESQKRARTTVK
jgi:hypothetical protein